MSNGMGKKETVEEGVVCLFILLAVRLSPGTTSYHIRLPCHCRAGQSYGIVGKSGSTSTPPA